mmetsp:Transcript_8911/g.19616  ORF Transcript_8911/g.19616 Transcript_8911/m.19616 type:complete len:80 (+) Transcript_8911:1035-1274(+)
MIGTKTKGFSTLQQTSLGKILRVNMEIGFLRLTTDNAITPIFQVNLCIPIYLSIILYILLIYCCIVEDENNFGYIIQVF